MNESDSRTDGKRRIIEGVADSIGLPTPEARQDFILRVTAKLPERNEADMECLEFCDNCGESILWRSDDPRRDQESPNPYPNLPEGQTWPDCLCQTRVMVAKLWEWRMEQLATEQRRKAEASV